MYGIQILVNTRNSAKSQGDHRKKHNKITSVNQKSFIMKQEILPTTRLVVTCIIFLCGVFPYIIWLAAKVSFDTGNKTTSINNNYRIWQQKYLD